MDFITKVRKFGQKNAIPNLYRYFVLGNILGYVIELLTTVTKSSLDIISWIDFSPADILHGQIWRLVTWVIVPAQNFDVWAVLFLLCVLTWGASLEQMIGSYRMNVLLIGGVLMMDVAGLVVYGIYYLIYGVGMPIYATTYYILISLLMALALYAPDAEVRFWFVLPMKMKWMLVLEGGYMVYALGKLFVTGLMMGGLNGGFLLLLLGGLSMIVALVNLFVFYKVSPGKVRLTHKQKVRRQEFRQQSQPVQMRNGAAIHKCAICGRTELDDPDLTFRYCSKCTGAKEYCQYHLFTHTHQ